jgi:hypothetical protein
MSHQDDEPLGNAFDITWLTVVLYQAQGNHPGHEPRVRIKALKARPQWSAFGGFRLNEFAVMARPSASASHEGHRRPPRAARERSTVPELGRIEISCNGSCAELLVCGVIDCLSRNYLRLDILKTSLLRLAHEPASSFQLGREQTSITLRHGIALNITCNWIAGPYFGIGLLYGPFKCAFIFRSQ